MIAHYKFGSEIRIGKMHREFCRAAPANPRRRAILLYTSSDPDILVALELADALLHLLVRIDAEALVLGDAGQLHVLGVKLLLHNLLERTEGEGLGLLKS